MLFDVLVIKYKSYRDLNDVDSLEQELASFKLVNQSLLKKAILQELEAKDLPRIFLKSNVDKKDAHEQELQQQYYTCPYFLHLVPCTDFTMHIPEFVVSRFPHLSITASLQLIAKMVCSIYTQVKTV